jgi:hypothetical protein
MDMLEIMGKALMEVSPDRTGTRFFPARGEKPSVSSSWLISLLCLDPSFHDRGFDVEALRADERSPSIRAVHLSRTSRSS